jgi:serine/threonine protein kinase
MLAAGTRVGPYEIVSWLGAGGMGEVYRARDTKLDREVALKTLPDDLAGQPRRLTRLRTEARILASLNHPGIATLHGLEDFYGGVPSWSWSWWRGRRSRTASAAGRCRCGRRCLSPTR